MALYFPRMLIISNNCLSQSDSNGRTLCNLIWKWPAEKLAQLCIHGNDRDTRICQNYFVVSDTQAAKAWLLNKKGAGSPIKGTQSEQPSGSKKNGKKRSLQRTPATMLLRDCAWRSMKWRGQGFNSWLEDFQPEVVLLQAGDLPAFFDIARTISEEREIPLLIYNSEDYYFKDYCYLGKNNWSRILYPIFRKRLQSSVRRAIGRASGCVYATEYLEDLYRSEFSGNSTFVMISSNREAVRESGGKEKKADAAPAIVYAGNLGVGRHKALMEIADALQNINVLFRLQVYGKTNDQTVLEALKNHGGIDYRGFVQYEELCKIISRADLLVHAESQEPFYARDVRYGFSTKIADSLASNVPFFVYANAKMTCVRYLRENACAFVACSREELEAVLSRALNNEEERKLCVENALATVRKNHDYGTNGDRFYHFLMDSIRER